MKGGSRATQEDGTPCNDVLIKSGPMMASKIFDREKTEALRKEYSTAIRHNFNSFLFEDEELLTAYAGYLLEYLDTRIKP